MPIILDTVNLFTLKEHIKIDHRIGERTVIQNVVLSRARRGSWDDAYNGCPKVTYVLIGFASFFALLTWWSLFHHDIFFKNPVRGRRILSFVARWVPVLCRTMCVDGPTFTLDVGTVPRNPSVFLRVLFVFDHVFLRTLSYRSFLRRDLFLSVHTTSRPTPTLLTTPYVHGYDAPWTKVGSGWRGTCPNTVIQCWLKSPGYQVQSCIRGKRRQHHPAHLLHHRKTAQERRCGNGLKWKRLVTTTASLKTNLAVW